MTTRAQDYKNDIERHGQDRDKVQDRHPKPQSVRFSHNDAPRADGTSSYAIEEHAGKPSRKSTRSSSNRALPANGLQRRALHDHLAPGAVSARHRMR